MTASRVIIYVFTFADGAVKRFPVRFSLPRLNVINPPPRDPPKWTELSFCQCSNCPLQAEQHPHCPVALNLTDILEEFRNSSSTEIVDVDVHVSNRRISKRCPLHEALSSLVGLVMAASGCPILEKLRPLVDSHLPFADSHETSYRVISAHLLAQYLRRRAGLHADWQLEDLARSYREIHVVNEAFAKRVKSLGIKDAGINAVVRLDALADIVSFTLSHDWWEEIEALFSPEAEPANSGA